MTGLDREIVETDRLPETVLEQAMSPALLLFPENVRHNVKAIVTACNGDPNRWRPHLKTTKSPVVWQELIDQGIRQFKCATTREAALMLQLLDDNGIDDGDLLIAYPLLGPALERAGQLAEMHPNTKLSILCEDVDAIESIPADLGIFVDVNPQMNRTGVPLEQVDRILDIARGAGARARGLGGVHFYDGHIRDDDPNLRRSRAHALYGQLLEIRNLLMEAGCEVGELITSGTLTFEAALEFEPFRDLENCIHRISPGTVVFHDFGTEMRSLATPLRPAAVVMTRVISQPAHDVVTCDGGSKSLAAEYGDPCVRILDHAHLTPLTPSEEHLPIRVDLSWGPAPQRGDVLLLVPRHVCPTINLAQEAILIEDGEVAGVIEIAARGHELMVD